MICGIGTDIAEVERMQEAVDKWGRKFLERIFTEREIAYCYSKRNPFPHLSARFAAKEAAVKALSCVVRDRHVYLGEVEVLNETSGRPRIVLGEEIKSLAGNLVLHLTISHERNYALATVIAEQID
jgi:holo-[acyl-carrier protein] synthase